MMEILSKPQFVNMMKQGKIPLATKILKPEELKDSNLYGLRGIVPSYKTKYYLTKSETLLGYNPSINYIQAMIDPKSIEYIYKDVTYIDLSKTGKFLGKDLVLTRYSVIRYADCKVPFTILNAELYQGNLFYSNVIGMPMKAAMNLRVETSRFAENIINHYCDIVGRNTILQLEKDYKDHVIEFSVFNKKIPREYFANGEYSNTIVWEVRKY